ncbi:hypothetical protein KEJ49_03740, partial [Candidatus Bathyarchaeota archaeon]|nr:hypothetical protein [Candidatus Bathyarchaeota archaeon]
MNERYFIRLYQEGDKREIVELLENVFNGWPKFDLNCSAIDHWKWKHKDNPQGKSIVVVAQSGDRIIGCLH